MFKRVVVAIDWSEQSEHAVETAKDLGRLSGGEIRVLHVHEVERLPPHGAGPLKRRPWCGRNEGEQAAIERVAETCKQMTDAGISATGEVRIALSGRVAAEIVEESKTWGADVIVIGSRGRTNLKGIMLGSTTNKLLHLTSLPVVVVR